MLKKLNKGISTPIAITIIIVLAVILGAGVLGYQYYWLPKEEAKLSETETLKDETAGWKTYINNDYGFELKYPTNFKTTADLNPAGYLGLYLGYNNTPYIGDIYIAVSKNYRNETATQYFEREKNDAIQGFASKCQTCANMDVEIGLYDCLANKADVMKIAGKDGFSCKNMPEKSTYASPIYVFNNGYIYKFYNYTESNQSYKIYTEILSNFKFID